MAVATRSVPVFSAVRKQPVSQRSAAVQRRYIRQGIFLLAIVISLAILFVWTRIQVIRLGYEVTRIRKEVSDLSEQKSRLEADIASLKAPERLERIAVETFGMRAPLSHEIVFIGDGGGTAAAQDVESNGADETRNPPVR